MTTFDPTLVPKATLKTMAKRMHNDECLAGLSLSKCQEILAKTFGHGSWHALSRPRPSRTAEAAADPSVRILLYELMLQCSESAVDIGASMEWIGHVAAMGGKVLLRDLAHDIHRGMQEGLPLAQAMDRCFDGHGSAEVFLVSQSEKTMGIHEGLRVARELAEQEGDRIDYRKLRGKEVSS